MMMASRGGALSMALASKAMEKQYNAQDNVSDHIGPTDDIEHGSIKSNSQDYEEHPSKYNTDSKPKSNKSAEFDSNQSINQIPMMGSFKAFNLPNTPGRERGGSLAENDLTGPLESEDFFVETTPN